MKKRIKITFRTKLYLTIAALLTLTGVFYAANPRKVATIPNAIAAPAGPAVPMANPTPFATLEGPNGVAAVPGAVFATQQCSQNLSVIDCQGNVSTAAVI